VRIALHSHSYRMSLVISTAIRHKRIHPALTAARQVGTRFTYPGGIEGRVDLGDSLHTEMVYLSKDSHPWSSNRARWPARC